MYCLLSYDDSPNGFFFFIIPSKPGITFDNGQAEVFLIQKPLRRFSRKAAMFVRKQNQGETPGEGFSSSARSAEFTSSCALWSIKDFAAALAIKGAAFKIHKPLKRLDPNFW